MEKEAEGSSVKCFMHDKIVPALGQRSSERERDCGGIPIANFVVTQGKGRNQR